MKVSTRTDGAAVVVRVEVARLVYATLDSFVDQVGPHLEDDRPAVVFDLSPVNYLDSAAIGCLMDLYRRAAAKQGRIALAGVLDRVERMLRMTGGPRVHSDLRIGGGRGSRTRGKRRGERMMRSIRMQGGREVELDGDLLAILEALYREVSVRSEFRNTYEAMTREISHLVDEMDAGERRSYLIESLFLNVVRYENERLAAFLRMVETPDQED